MYEYIHVRTLHKFVRKISKESTTKKNNKGTCVRVFYYIFFVYTNITGNNGCSFNVYVRYLINELAKIIRFFDSIRAFCISHEMKGSFKTKRKKIGETSNAKKKKKIKIYFRSVSFLRLVKGFFTRFSS